MSEQDNTSELRGNVLDAYTALIRVHLESDQPYRFQTIIKLCKHAHELAKLSAINVDAVLKGRGDVPGIRYDVDEGGIIVNGGVRRRHEMDGMREIIHQVSSLFESSTKASNEQMLDRLGRARDVLIDMGRPPESIAVIEGKIDAIIADMAQQEGLDDAVVPTELLRRHQAEGQERGQLRAGSGAALGDGEGSAPGVPSERDQEGLDRQDDGPHPSNGAGRHSWPDPQGASIAGEAPQADS